MYELQLVNNGFLAEYSEDNKVFVESVLLDSETLKRLNSDDNDYADFIDVEFLSACKKVDRVDTLVAVTSGFMAFLLDQLLIRKNIKEKDLDEDEIIKVLPLVLRQYSDKNKDIDKEIDEYIANWEHKIQNAYKYQNLVFDFCEDLSFSGLFIKVIEYCFDLSIGLDEMASLVIKKEKHDLKTDSIVEKAQMAVVDWFVDQAYQYKKSGKYKKEFAQIEKIVKDIKKIAFKDHKFDREQLKEWFHNCNFKIEVQQIVSTSEMISVVRKELNNTFDDIKRMRFNHMLKILKTTEGNKMISNKYTYGIKNYYYVFETMVDKLFDGIKESEKKKYNPNGFWQLNNQNPRLASSLRPDTILKRNGATYILDAKMYQYGVTKDVRDLPETQSIQKQITYGDHVFNSLDKSDNPKVRNAFILPYNKKLENFVNDPNTLKYNDGNLAYFGQAYTDWRNTEDPKDYEKVYAFGIDFNYLLENYNRPDYAIIDTLCKRIEELIKPV